MLLTPVTNLTEVLLILVESCHGRHCHWWQISASIIDTGGKFAAGIVDTGGNFATDINNTSETDSKICRQCR